LSRLSGQLASSCTPIDLRKADLFLEERTPGIEDPACVLRNVDKVTGLLSSLSCPADATEERPFFLPKSELPDRWPLWEQAVQEWARRQMDTWNATPDHSGSLLPLPLAPTKECDPSLTPGRLSKPEVRLLAPPANANVSFPVFTVEIEFRSLAPVREVKYSIDGKQTGVFTAPPYMGPIRAPRSLETTGTHTLSVTLTDEYFNTASDAVTIRFGIDAVTPRVRLLDGALPLPAGFRSAFPPQ
ncbi:MAG: Ig-like domain-containing protein, partial [Candidatus Peribacteraceae bacterium]